MVVVVVVVDSYKAEFEFNSKVNYKILYTYRNTVFGETGLLGWYAIHNF